MYLYYHFRERLWNQVLNGPQSCMGSLWKDFVVISGEKSRILCLVSSLSEVSLRPDHSRNKLDLINSRVIIEMQTMQQILFRSQFIEIKTNEQTKCIKCLTIKTPFRKVIIITVIKELKIRGDRTAIRHWDYVCSKSNVWNRNSIVLLLKITIFLPENVFQAAMICQEFWQKNFKKAPQKMATGGELSDLSYGAFRFGRGKCIRWIKNTRVTGRRWPRRGQTSF